MAGLSTALQAGAVPSAATGGPPSSSTAVGGISGVDLSEVDFEYVERLGSKNDAQKLRRVIAALEEEGGYPQLLKAAKDTLKRIDPKSLTPDVGPASVDELKDAQADILQWSQSEKARDEALRREATTSSRPTSAVPVRGHGAPAPTTTANDKEKQKNPLLNLGQELDPSTLTPAELSAAALAEKSKGNECFRAHEYEDAARYYTRGLHLTPTDPNLLNNRALTFLKLKNPDAALNDAELVLKNNPTNWKALWRRAQVHETKHFLERALDDLKCAEQCYAQSEEAVKAGGKPHPDLAKSRKKMEQALYAQQPNHPYVQHLKPAKANNKKKAQNGKSGARPTHEEDEKEESKEQEPPVAKSFKRMQIAEVDDDDDEEEEEDDGEREEKRAEAGPSTSSSGSSSSSAAPLNRMTIAEVDDDDEDDEDEDDDEHNPHGETEDTEDKGPIETECNTQRNKCDAPVCASGTSRDKPPATTPFPVSAPSPSPSPSSVVDPATLPDGSRQLYEEVDALKSEGVRAFQNGKYAESIQPFHKAIRMVLERAHSSNVSVSTHHKERLTDRELIQMVPFEFLHMLLTLYSNLSASYSNLATGSDADATSAMKAASDAGVDLGISRSDLEADDSPSTTSSPSRASLEALRTAYNQQVLDLVTFGSLVLKRIALEITKHQREASGGAHPHVPGSGGVGLGTGAIPRGHGVVDLELAGTPVLPSASPLPSHLLGSLLAPQQISILKKLYLRRALAADRAGMHKLALDDLSYTLAVARDYPGSRPSERIEGGPTMLARFVTKYLEEMLHTIEEAKSKANEAFATEEWERSQQLYTRAIENISNVSQTIRSVSSATPSTNQSSLASTDAQRFLSLLNPHSSMLAAMPSNKDRPASEETVGKIFRLRMQLLANRALTFLKRADEGCEEASKETHDELLKRSLADAEVVIRELTLLFGRALNPRSANDPLYTPQTHPKMALLLAKAQHRAALACMSLARWNAALDHLYAAQRANPALDLKSDLERAQREVERVSESQRTVERENQRMAQDGVNKIQVVADYSNTEKEIQDKEKLREIAEKQTECRRQLPVTSSPGPTSTSAPSSSTSTSVRKSPQPSQPVFTSRSGGMMIEVMTDDEEDDDDADDGDDESSSMKCGDQPGPVEDLRNLEREAVAAAQARAAAQHQQAEAEAEAAKRRTAASATPTKSSLQVPSVPPSPSTPSSSSPSSLRPSSTSPLPPSPLTGTIRSFQLPPIPTNAVAFERDWQMLRHRDPSLFYDYFKRIDPEALPKIFAVSASLTLGLFGALLNCVSSRYILDTPSRALEVLEALSKVDRFTLNVQLLPTNVKNGVKDALKKLKQDIDKETTSSNTSGVDKDLLQSVAKKYGATL